MGYAQKNTTVIKTLDILNLFARYDKLSLQELMNLSGMPRTSLLRMLASLEEMGFLQKDGHGKYALGLIFLEFGQRVAERLDIRGIALPVMRQLQQDADEAVNLIIVDGNDAVYIEKIETSHPVKAYTAIGRRAPLYGGACPKILLAFMPEAERERYIQETKLVQYAQGTIVDKEELRQEIQMIRSRGYSVSHSELRDFTSAVAVPIFNQEGHCVAGLSLVGLTVRFTADRIDRFVPLLKAAAGEISGQMGWRGKDNVT